MIAKCKKCNKTFPTYPSRIKKGLGNYCSQKCNYSDRGPLSEKQKKKISKAVKKNLPSTAWKKGNKPWNTGLKGEYGTNRKGRIYEEIYGKERSQKIKSDMSLAKKGKTHIEIFGEEGAKRRKEFIYNICFIRNTISKTYEFHFL